MQPAIPHANQREHEQAILAQWRLAANELGESKALADDEALRAHLFDRNFTSIYQSYAGICAAAYRGVALLYVKVLKSGSTALCDAMRAVNDASYPPHLAFLGSADARRPGNGPLNPLGWHPAAADRVYDAIQQLRRADRLRQRLVVFSAVREPLQHFVAGYAEVMLYKTRSDTRAAASGKAATTAAAAAAAMAAAVAPSVVTSAGPGRSAGVQSQVLSDREGGAPLLVRDSRSSTASAKNYLRRVVTAELDLTHRSGDRAGSDRLMPTSHMLPQSAFFSRAQPGAIGRSCCDGHIDLLTSMERLGEAWRMIGASVQAAALLRDPRASPHAWPVFNQSTRSRHSQSNAHASFPPRVAMERLLRDSPPHARALCRILLPDYECFGYSLPPVCAAAIGPAHGVSCELRRLPRRL